MTDPDRSPLFFWKASGNYGEFSQWFKLASFVCNDKRFATAEQCLMYGKADISGDVEMAEKILRSPCLHPAKHRALGRKVKPFDQTTWDNQSIGVALLGNLCKFTQDSQLQARLMATGKRMLVESSPSDRIWGIGYSAEIAMENRSTWGDNRLGKVLMMVRAIIAYRIRRGMVVPVTEASDLHGIDINAAVREYESMGASTKM